MGSGGGRNDGLDLLRATGAFLVFATHLFHWFGQTWLGPLADAGGLGVYIFFPLSGFLLSRPFVLGRVDLRRYAIHRVARIAPAYYLALVGLAALGLVPTLLSNPIPWLTFTTNTFAFHDLEISGFGPAWTLGIEILFYAMLPALALIRSTRWLVAVTVVMWAISTQMQPPSWLFYQLPAHLWAFLAGMLAARLVGVRPLAVAGPGMIVAGLLIHAPNSLDIGLPLVVAGSCLTMLWAVAARPRIPLARAAADLSYAVYLWHLGITIIVARYVSGPLLVPVAMIAVLLVAGLSFRYVERPLLRWASAWVRSGHDQRPGPARTGARGPATPVAP